MNTPEKTIQNQEIVISRAIEILQAQLDKMHETTDPENVDWSDVYKFSKAADVAREVIASFSE